jgi:steroid 5-alpha reductase family enzyme
MLSKIHIPKLLPLDYHAAKKQYQETAKVPANYHRTDLDRGFNTTGLFAWSRHPSFAAEQSFWVTLYVWASHITDAPINWTIIGPAAYLILFQASTYFTEWISAKKYPEYKEYQRRVGMFIPRIFNLKGAGPGDFSDKRTKKEL